MNSLKDSALLVRCVRHQFNVSVKDNIAAAMVDEKVDAHDVGNFYKKLFKDNDLIKGVFKKQTELYQFHIKYTLPWMDGGVRILPAKFYDEYTSAIAQKRDELQRLLNDLEPQYAQAVSQDKARIGTLAAHTDYPSFDGFRSKFGVDVYLFPIPSSEDFRVKVSDEAKQELDRFVEESKIRAKEELYDRLKTLLDNIIDQCSKDKPRIHESLLTNAADLSHVMGILNVHDDNDVKQLADELKRVSHRSIVNLRTSINYRQETIAECRSIKDMMNAPIMTVVAAAPADMAFSDLI